MEQGIRPKNPLPILIVLYCASFLASFNENLVNTGLVDIMGEFSITSQTAQWLVTGYMIVTAIVVTVVAFLLKRFSLKTVFVAASLILIIGSAVCFIAPTFDTLLTGRLFASIGTGLFIPAMMSTTLAIAPRKKLGTYMSIGGCMITFGPALAPVVTGAMVTGLGWRSIFLAPLASVAVLLVIGMFLVTSIREKEHVTLDIPSVVLSAVGLTLFVYGINVMLSDTIVAIVTIIVGLAIIAAFVVRQGHLKEPLLNLEPLRNRRFATTCVLVVVAMMTTFSMSVLLPLYYEGASGVSAFAAGALILIPILVNAGTAIIGGRTMDAHGEWPLFPIGFLIVALGQIAVCITGVTAAIIPVLVASIFVYAGVGLVLSPSQTSGLSTLPAPMNPHGVAIMSEFIQVAACIGPALFTGVLSSVVQGAEEASPLAQAQGFSAAVTVAAVIAVAGFITSYVYARTCKTQRISAPIAAPKARTHDKPAIATVMKTDAYTVDASASVLDAMRLMLERHTSGLPVVESNGHVCGFISDGDIMKSLAPFTSSTAGLAGLASGLVVYADDREFNAKLMELMSANVMEYATSHVIAIDATDSIEDACTLLGERRIKKVPVLSHGKLAGTLSRADVTRYLMESFSELSTQSA